MQTASSEALIGWKSGKTTFVPLWDLMEGAWVWNLKTSTNHFSNQRVLNDSLIFRRQAFTPSYDMQNDSPPWYSRAMLIAHFTCVYK